MKYERLTRSGYKVNTGSPLTDCIIRRLIELEDKIENGTLVELPCKVGDTIYTIVKNCKREYMSKETGKYVNDSCDNYTDYDYERVSYCSVCKKDYCELYVNVCCDKCKDRLEIEEEKFDYTKITKVFSSPYFVGIDERGWFGVYFTTKEEAEAKLKELGRKDE